MVFVKTGLCLIVSLGFFTLKMFSGFSAEGKNQKQHCSICDLTLNRPECRNEFLPNKELFHCPLTR